MQSSLRNALTVLVSALAMLAAVYGCAQRDNISIETHPSARDLTALPIKSSRSVSFETTEGTMMDIDLSPDGKTLVLTLLGDLYTVPVDGGQARQLTRGLGWDARPAWSPDGKLIAYVSDHRGSDDIWIMQSDGSARRILVAGASAKPQWTPDGRHILADGAFHHVVGGAIPLAGGDRGPAQLSADGRFIYFPQTRYAKETLQGRELDVPRGSILARINLATGSREEIAALSESDGKPIVSPDGGWVAYATPSVEADEGVETGEGQVWGLRVRNLATGDERWLARPVDYFQTRSRSYVWTHDSKAIIAAFGGKIHRIDVKGGTDEVIPFVAHVEAELGPLNYHTYRVSDDRLRVRYMRDIQRSPNDGRLLFSALGRIYTRAADEATPTILVDQPHIQSDPAYSPDGRWVAYVTWSDTAGGQVWRVPSEGGIPEQLTREPALYGQPTWSPDGTRIAVIASDWTNRWRMWGRADAYGPLGSRSRMSGELRMLPSQGGPARMIANNVPIYTEPSFVKGGELIAFVQTNEHGGQPYSAADRRLVLARLDGTGSRTVATIPRSIYGAQFIPSPNGRFLAYTWIEDLYLTPLPPNGDSITIDMSFNETLPVVRLTDTGGWDPRWEENGRRLTWAYADRFFSKNVERVMASVAPQAGGERPGADKSEFADADVQPDEEVRIDLAVPRYYARGTVALRGGRVITMAGDEVIEDATVLVSDGRITAVGPSSSIQIPQGSDIVDVAGKTVIPGLVDLHAHTGPPIGVPLQNSWEFISRLAYGTTTARDVSLLGNACFGYYERVEIGDMIGPRSLCVGLEINYNILNRNEFATINSARNFLKRYAALGAVVLKDYAARTRRHRHNLLIAARELGINVTGHPELGEYFSATPVIDGEGGMEHTFWGQPQIYDDLAQLMARSGTVWSPTLTRFVTPTLLGRYDVRNDRKARHFISHDEIGSEDESSQTGQNMSSTSPSYALSIEFAEGVTRVVRRGGLVGMGSHGDVNGLQAHWELWHYVRGGMTPLEALRAGTLNGAIALGMQEDLGSIEVGKIADLIVLDRNPLEDIENTLSIRYVMKSGELFQGETLAAIWPDERPAPEWKPRYKN